MKILFDNLLLLATRSAIHQDDNYPCENLAHPFLKKIFKSTAASDSITLAWSTSQIISCLYLAFTNATTMTAQLLDASDVVLENITLTPSDPGINFAPVYGVRKAIINISLPSGLVYLGTIGIGLAYAMPDPLGDWKYGSIDNSDKTSSPDGQVLINKIPPLRQVVVNFRVSDYETYDSIKNLIDAISRPVFADPFELAHLQFLPIYADINGGFGNPSKGDHEFAFSLNFTEAR